MGDADGTRTDVTLCEIMIFFFTQLLDLCVISDVLDQAWANFLSP